ncbi:oleosin L-like [Silene latifolia]|uniref:oleosin L-like n=1 Tax=Silene latifolia TaxID=37657 RepID=UPI003D78292A
MADYLQQHGGLQGQQLTHRGQLTTTPYGQQQNPRAHQMVKAATAATAGGSLLVLSGLTLTGTVIALTIATPLLVIFSPVLVPAAITVFLLTTGFLSSGAFGIAALSVLAWIYRFMTGQHPVGADQLEMARMKLAGKARDVKDTAQHYGQQAMEGVGGGDRDVGTRHTSGGGRDTTTTRVHQTTTSST